MDAEGVREDGWAEMNKVKLQEIKRCRLQREELCRAGCSAKVLRCAGYCWKIKGCRLQREGLVNAGRSVRNWKTGYSCKDGRLPAAAREPGHDGRLNVPPSTLVVPRCNWARLRGLRVACTKVLKFRRFSEPMVSIVQCS